MAAAWQARTGLRTARSASAALCLQAAHATSVSNSPPSAPRSALPSCSSIDAAVLVASFFLTIV